MYSSHNNSMLFSLPSPPISNHRSTTTTTMMMIDRLTRHDDNVELKPFLLTKSKHDEYYLPPIQHVYTPSSSPFDHSSESASEEDEDYTTPYRKNSIASLLNSPTPQPVQLKRGRPRQEKTTPVVMKRRRKEQQDCLLSNELLPRATKGLRHFSKQVCDKVAEKGITTYNEVADELAMDIQKSIGSKHSYDQKNIRRRVYDALNVLMAMNIITKDKKVIKWLGIPECYNSNKAPSRNEEQKELLKEIEKEELRQSELLHSLHLLRGIVNDKIAKHDHISNVILRNQQSPEKDESRKIALPFFIVRCPSMNAQDIQLSSDQHSAVISFMNDNNDDQHVIIEDTEVLRHLNI
ncbi:hypothetical protein G6F70_000750 [Rhizopus microsporus]|uniref:Transcription factor Dp, member 3 n=2 Tax=Rhizopus TaxID=4842 RepID=A0A367J649_RHIAZ|nr:hypothetical protein G6F71_000549 [Rhizopus microsporus]RCH85211.1 transcription factor Dp, member 3 [Rhizopus azygosporus]KAG1204094.1 hypothetical protein G6F70_000750 [Rhizopus microsporus]KAG1215487.1 hypothetical protein G6F69_001005 [Rhizopus microsporus]KAG1238035.1 hypothetical protein G6F67_000775 [Rhizopus microsporus]